MSQTYARPEAARYDVVIVGGGIYGAAISWFLSRDRGFDGTILVVEKDPSYAKAATSHTNSCIRQQFSTAINVEISRFGAAFIKGFRDHLGDARVPKIVLQPFGYLFLADTETALANLKDQYTVQQAAGAATMHLTRDEIAERYPFYALDDILGGNHNLLDEGYFDGNTMFDWWKRLSRENGVTWLTNEAVELKLSANGTRVEGVTFQTGETVACGTLVNSGGTWGVRTARMAGLDLPIEPRKRYTYIFDAAQPLDRDLPLTIDPSGVHVRTDGRYYMVGSAGHDDPAVDPDDFAADHGLWEDKVWPALASRIPQFEAVKLINFWVGHYDYNRIDQNAIVGPDPRVTNFIYANGFSGHGLQQSPALARGIAEWIAYGAYRTLDLSPLGIARLTQPRSAREQAVI